MLTLAASASASPPDFTDPEYVFTGLDRPTNLEFAPNGRVFITEQGGRVYTAASVDSTRSLLVDVGEVTHDFWDRGMLGMAVHPDFPGLPYLYLLHAYGTPLHSSMGPPWGDPCATPPGPTGDGCVVSGRLLRLTLGESGTSVTDTDVLIWDWCQQFPSHSIGDLAFAPDGALYVSAGDGASFNEVDWGQLGGSPGSPTPRNPCGDPPGGIGGAMTAPTAEGGALRAQDLRTSGDPVSPSGAVLRINPLYDPDNPQSNLTLPNNPNIGHSDPIGKLIVAYGLRNPYRITFRPGTDDLYIGDVGWGLWEEVNVHPSPTTSVRNYGWPCYEGGIGNSIRQSSYDNANLAICENLYAEQASNPATVRASLFAYHHNFAITDPNGPGSPNPADACPPAAPPAPVTSSITGLAFYEGGSYPGEYAGALFGADYSRNCIWVMYPDASGTPSPSTIEIFHQGSNLSPVDLAMGPDGNMYFVSRDQGAVGRFRWTGQNAPPVAVIQAMPTSGNAPLQVVLSGSNSHDPNGHQIVEYAWDLDNNGSFETFGETIAHTFGPGSHTVRLRVRDFLGALSVPVSVLINASNSAPTVDIASPLATTSWSVGDQINFSATATDPQEGTLPGARFSWDLVIHHCEGVSSCHEHHIQSWEGTASGSFTAPDHNYPSHLELRVEVSDMYGLKAFDSVEIHPRTVQISLASEPPGVVIGAGTGSAATPYTLEVIVGSRVGIQAPLFHQDEDVSWQFSRWAHGGAQAQTFVAPATNTTLTAIYELQNRFRDDDGHIFEEDIEWLAARDVTRGCNPPANDMFCPEARVTRGQMAAFFVRALGLPAGQTDLFDDDDGHLFEAEIDRLAAAGITKGCNPPTNDRFCPDDYVTRGQMAAFFVRALGLPAGQSDLFDDDDGHLFESEIDRLATVGITRGCNPPTNDRFCPDDYVTRGQMAAFFHRAAPWLP